MIESGSLTPGVDRAAWGLPPGTALRYEAPSASLRQLFPSFAVLDSDPALWKGPDSWILPSAAQIWIVLADAPVTVAVRRRKAAPLGAAVVLGPTSQVTPVTSRGGVSIVIDVSPVGWARLFGPTAEGMRDQVAPLDQLLGAGWADELTARLFESDRAGAVKPILEDWLGARVPPPGKDEALIARAHVALLDAASIEAAAAMTGITRRALLSLCNRYFGYSPKVLMRRFRFLRALTTMLTAAAPPDFSTPPPGYHDVPHFLRDGNLLLGMTPRRFLAMPMPYLRSVLRARTQVLGEPMAMFDRADEHLR